MESVEKNDQHIVGQEIISIYHGYDTKGGCDAGDDVLTGDNSDDKEAVEAGLRILRFSVEVPRRDEIRSTESELVLAEGQADKADMVRSPETSDEDYVRRSTSRCQEKENGKSEEDVFALVWRRRTSV